MFFDKRKANNYGILQQIRHFWRVSVDSEQLPVGKQPKKSKHHSKYKVLIAASMVGNKQNTTWIEKSTQINYMLGSWVQYDIFVLNMAANEHNIFFVGFWFTPKLHTRIFVDNAIGSL